MLDNVMAWIKNNEGNINGSPRKVSRKKSGFIKFKW